LQRHHRGLFVARLSSASQSRFIFKPVERAAQLEGEHVAALIVDAVNRIASSPTSGICHRPDVIAASAMVIVDVNQE
jgi:hypothetical protein